MRFHHKNAKAYSFDVTLDLGKMAQSQKAGT